VCEILFRLQAGSYDVIKTGHVADFDIAAAIRLKITMLE
jgi:hypothetical protein